MISHGFHLAGKHLVQLGTAKLVLAGPGRSFRRALVDKRYFQVAGLTADPRQDAVQQAVLFGRGGRLGAELDRFRALQRQNVIPHSVNSCGKLGGTIGFQLIQLIQAEQQQHNIRRGGAHFIAAVGIISLGDPVHQADNFRLIVCGPLFIRRFAQRFLQAGKAALLRKVQPVQPAQRVILHEFVIFTNFRRIIEPRHNAGNGGKNRIRAKIFQHTDTFVALLDIKAAHVLIRFNGIVDALFHMGHAQGKPLAGKLSVFGQQRHKVGSKRHGAAGGFGAYHIIQRYFNGAKRYLAFGICFFQQFIQRRQIGVFACRCLFTVIAHAQSLSAVVFIYGFYTLHPVPPPAVVVPSFFLILWACML